MSKRSLDEISSSSSSSSSPSSSPSPSLLHEEGVTCDDALEKSFVRKPKFVLGGVSIKPFTKLQDEMLVKAIMRFEYSNPTHYLDKICFRAVRRFMAKGLNIKTTALPFSAPQLEVRWKILLSQVDGYGPVDKDNENDAHEGEGESEGGDGDWDEDEINQLVLAVNEAKKSQDILDWKWIADKVCPGGPQDFECYLKYAQVRYEKEQTDCEDMKVSRARWDKEEDEKLIQTVGRCGGGPGHEGFSWSRVANTMKNRNAPQCKRRWVNHLQPAAFGEAINKTSWTVLETHFLLELVLRASKTSEGVIWRKISDYFCGRRSAAQCLQKYNSIKNINKYHNSKKKKKRIKKI